MILLFPLNEWTYLESAWKIYDLKMLTELKFFAKCLTILIYHKEHSCVKKTGKEISLLYASFRGTNSW